MTIVELDLSPTWITSLIDDTISVRVRKLERTETEGVVGTVVNYGGRSVAEATSEKSRSTQLDLFVDSREDEQQLRQWWRTTEPLLLRDNLGWWRPGVIFQGVVVDVVPTTVQPERLIKVSVSFMDIDWDFGV